MNIIECKNNPVRQWIGRRIVWLSLALPNCCQLTEWNYKLFRFGLHLSFSVSPINR